MSTPKPDDQMARTFDEAYLACASEHGDETDLCCVRAGLAAVAPAMGTRQRRRAEKAETECNNLRRWGTAHAGRARLAEQENARLRAQLGTTVAQLADIRILYDKAAAELANVARTVADAVNSVTTRAPEPDPVTEERRRIQKLITTPALAALRCIPDGPSQQGCVTHDGATVRERLRAAYLAAFPERLRDDQPQPRPGADPPE